MGMLIIRGIGHVFSFSHTKMLVQSKFEPTTSELIVIYIFKLATKSDYFRVSRYIKLYNGKRVKIRLEIEPYPIWVNFIKITNLSYKRTPIG